MALGILIRMSEKQPVGLCYHLFLKTMHTLQLQHISHTYPNGVKALDQLNLSISTGMFGLLGPNGAGKSSLMRTIAALQQPSTGTLFFDEIDILKQPQALRKRLGYLPQEFGVYPRLSAYELLDYLAILKGVHPPKKRKAQIESLLLQTNLQAHGKKAVSSFSGGMRQRFGIAQALLGDPKLIIVDEPTAGLDPEERNRFHNLLSDVASDRIVILSTHIVEDVRELCSNMAIMNAGQIVRQGQPNELIADLAGKVWQKTIEKRALERYQTTFEVISTRLLAGKTLIHVLADELPEQGFERISPDLEDVYFATLHHHQKELNHV